jgi:hypothetical protein
VASLLRKMTQTILLYFLYIPTIMIWCIIVGKIAQQSHLSQSVRSLLIVQKSTKMKIIGNYFGNYFFEFSDNLTYRCLERAVVSIIYVMYGFAYATEM